MTHPVCRRALLGTFIALLAAPAAAQGSDLSAAPRTRSGLGILDTREGTGEVAAAGRTVRVHYTGWLLESGARGKKFDSSRDRGQPFEFPLGAGRVIKGWDEGVAGMKIGGQRTLVIPADLGYGARGAGNAIPPNSVLVFDVELLGLR
jgi:FKBP-type peptidyl-prolyl cis-trans isomerase